MSSIKYRTESEKDPMITFQIQSVNFEHQADVALVDSVIIDYDFILVHKVQHLILVI